MKPASMKPDIRLKARQLLLDVQTGDTVFGCAEFKNYKTTALKIVLLYIYAPRLVIEHNT